MADLTETRYAKSGEVHLAYQIVGDGPPDLVFVPGFASHVELQWEEPNQAHFFNRLASFSRLIRFDKRGTGLSDRVIGTVALEERMDDLRAVMDAAECERAVLLALSEGGPLSMVFAATYPERTSALVLWNTFARLLRDVDYDFGIAPETREQMLGSISQAWGDGTFVGMFAASAAADPAFSQWWARFERHSISPGAVADVMGIVTAFDARAVLASIHVPTLVLRTTNDLLVPAEVARFPAEHISGALTSSGPLSMPQQWATGDGRSSSTVTTAQCAASLIASRDGRSTPPATASSHLSTVRRAHYAALRPSLTTSGHWGSTYEQASIPESASSWGTS